MRYILGFGPYKHLGFVLLHAKASLCGALPLPLENSGNNNENMKQDKATPFHRSNKIAVFPFSELIPFKYI